MAPRTISQIAGEFGLARGASSDPFSRQEAAVLENVQRSLSENRSRAEELAARKGFGRSTFSEGLFEKQAGDVLSNVNVALSRARTDEALREADFERGIIAQELGADRQSRLLQEQTAAETSLIGARGEQQRSTLADQILGNVELARVQAEEARATQAQQISGEAGLIGARGAEERLTLQGRGDVEAELIRARGAQDILAIEARQASSKELITQEAEQKRKTIQEQSRLAFEQLKESNAAQERLAITTGQQQRLTQAESYIEKNKAIQLQSQNRIAEINLQYQNDLKAMNERFDRIRADLPFELQEKAKYEKDVLNTQLNIIREQKLTDTVIQTTLSYLLSNFESLGGIGNIGGLSILGDLS